MHEHAMPRLDALLREAGTRIDAADAAALLMHALGRSRSWLYAHGDEAIDAVSAQRFAGLLARREAGEPVASSPVAAASGASSCRSVRTP